MLGSMNRTKDGWPVIKTKAAIAHTRKAATICGLAAGCVAALLTYLLIPDVLIALFAGLVAAIVADVLYYWYRFRRHSGRHAHRINS